MTLTEAEAATKWCPMAHVLVATDDIKGTGNRYAEGADLDVLNPLQARCIGSECMAWRWHQKRNPNWKPVHQMIASYPSHPDDEEPAYIRDDEHGYCGLAGRAA